jgi:hypothetical protein
MNAIILKGAALRQPHLPQSGPRAKTIAHPSPVAFKAHSPVYALKKTHVQAIFLHCAKVSHYDMQI